MKINSLKKYYVIVHKNGAPDFSTISGWKKGSIYQFMKYDNGHDWAYWRDKHGYKCVKVDIHFNLVK